MKDKKSESIEIEKLVDDMVNDRIPNNVTIYLDLAVISEVFTKKRMELIKKIETANPQSIQELADKLNRKKQAVHRDLKLLEGHNLIELIKDGKIVIPILSKEMIYIPLKHQKFENNPHLSKLFSDHNTKHTGEEIIDAEIYIGNSNVNKLLNEVMG